MAKTKHKGRRKHKKSLEEKLLARAAGELQTMAFGYQLFTRLFPALSPLVPIAQFIFKGMATMMTEMLQAAQTHRALKEGYEQLLGEKLEDKVDVHAGNTRVYVQ